MAAIRIPVRHRGPLGLVASMTLEQFEALVDCFRPQEGDISTSRVIGEIALAVEDIDEPVMLFDALIGAWAYGKGADLTQEDAARDVASSDLLELSEPERNILIDRLTTLFHERVMDLFAHAASVRAEDEYSYCTSRILSDLRPLFASDEEASPIAALIRHSLKFDVHIDGRIESVVIAVNDRALNDIASGVERALKKAESLRDIAHKAGIQVVDSEEIH